PPRRKAISMPGFQVINPLEQFRQSAMQHLQSSLSHVRLRRETDDELPGFDICSNTRSAARLSALSDAKVSGYANLPAQHHVIFQRRATGHAYLRTEDAMLADHDVEAHLHQVINLGALTDNRAAEAGAIDRAVGA